MSNLTAPNLPDSEYLALSDLYYATDGQRWEHRWDIQSSNPCTDKWYGVGCVLSYPFTEYHVVNLTLSENGLFGTIPASVGNLTYLELCVLNSNYQISGTIPAELLWLPNLRMLSLGYNLLNGTIPLPPPGWSTQSNLEALDVQHNLLSGAIPTYVLSLLSNVYALNMLFNVFTGTIPDALLWSPQYTTLDLSYNRLWGVIPGPPPGWSESGSRLESLTIEGSAGLSPIPQTLTGTLPVQFAGLSNLRYISLANNQMSGDASVLPSTLEYVDLTGNHFAGSLDSLSFVTSGKLTVLYLTENCIYGTIPAAICANAALTEIDMGSMNSHPSCSTTWFRRSGYISHRTLTGSIPACMFNYTSLNAIGLQYNMLSGVVDISGINFNPYAEVSLSYNQLRGPFPRTMAASNDFYLYADRNKFSGILAAEDNNALELSAQNNRISGTIPAFMLERPLTLDTKSLMSGNLFSCNWAETDVPAGANNFQCGTNAFNKMYIAWIACTLTVSIVLCSALMYTGHGVVQKWKNNVRTWYAAAMHGPGLQQIWKACRCILWCGTVCTLVCVFVLAPVYVVLNVYFGTYTYQYAWTVASVLLSGPTAFAVQLVLFLLVLCVAAYLCWGMEGVVFSNAKLVHAGESVNVTVGSNVRPYIIGCAFVLVNFVVVAVVNVAYVSTSLYLPSLKYQIAIATFKTGWGVLCMPYLSRWVVYELSAARHDYFTLELFVSLMNNIMIPFMAVVAVSRECLFDLYGGVFYDIYEYDIPTPFYYSYQCAYTYFNFYVNAYVSVSIFTVLGIPIIEFTLLQMHRRAPVGTFPHLLLNRLLARSLRPIARDTADIPARSIFRPYFDTTQFLVSQFTNLALILTMGVVFPPLVLCLLVTMFCTTAYAVLKVGRLLEHAAEANLSQYAEIIRQESAGVVSAKLLSRTGWLLFFFTCWFMALFLFDTLGDAQGARRSYWVLIVVPLTPVVACVAKCMCGVYSERSSGKGDPSSEADATTTTPCGIEMRETLSPMRSAV